MSPQQQAEIIELAERSIANLLGNKLIIEIRNSDSPFLTQIAVDFMTAIEKLEEVLLLIQDRSKCNECAKAEEMLSGPQFQ